MPASVRAHWEGSGLLAPGRTSRAGSVGLAPGGPSAAGSAMKAQSLDGGLSGLGAGATSAPPPVAPLAHSAAGVTLAAHGRVLLWCVGLLTGICMLSCS